ncbi:MAG: hypothetical protein AB4352_17145 [Hormoscilla sp.]
MSRYGDPFENKDLKRLQLFIYLIPVIGFFPALWTLYRRTGDRRQLVVSRLAVVLGLLWVVSHGLVETGASSFESWRLPWLLSSSLLTSSYFMISFWLMVRVWRRQSLRLPGMSRLGDRLP